MKYCQPVQFQANVIKVDQLFWIRIVFAPKTLIKCIQLFNQFMCESRIKQFSPHCVSTFSWMVSFLLELYWEDISLLLSYFINLKIMVLINVGQSLISGWIDIGITSFLMYRLSQRSWFSKTLKISGFFRFSGMFIVFTSWPKVSELTTKMPLFCFLTNLQPQMYQRNSWIKFFCLIYLFSAMSASKFDVTSLSTTKSLRLSNFLTR